METSPQRKDINMNELQIRTLLKEFDYDKNELEDIFEFLLFMAHGIEKLNERK